MPFDSFQQVSMKARKIFAEILGVHVSTTIAFGFKTKNLYQFPTLKKLYSCVLVQSQSGPA